MKALIPILLTLGMATSLFASGSRQVRFAPKQCGYSVVIYRLVGPAGTAFRYNDRNFVIARQGSIEVLAEKNRNTYRTESGIRQIDDRLTRDEFGIVTVHLDPSSSF